MAADADWQDAEIRFAPRDDASEEECCCARCGSDVTFEDCYNCEDGYSYHDCGEDCCCCIDPEPNVLCDICRGRGGWSVCISSPEWCEANPLPGREGIERGKVEWFDVPPRTPEKPHV